MRQVDTVNAFGQAGGFESLIACLSPPEVVQRPALPLPTPARAPLAGAPPPLPPRPPPSTTTPSTVVANPTDSVEGDERHDAAVESPIAVSSRPPLPPRPNVGSTGEGGGVKKSEGGAGAAPEGVPLEALRYALVAVSSVRALLARRVSRAIIEKTASAVSAALKRWVEVRYCWGIGEGICDGRCSCPLWVGFRMIYPL